MATVQINSSGDFTTVSAWAADLDGDSLAEDQIGEISGLITETSQILFQNITPNGFYVKLRSNQANSFTSNASVLSNKLQWNSNNGAAITSSATADSLKINTGLLFEAREIQLKHTGNYGGPIRMDSAGVLESCIFDRSSSTFNNYALVAWLTATDIYANNCLFVASHASGTKICVSPDGNQYYRNCGFVRNSTPAGSIGLSLVFGTLRHFENCVLYNWEEDCRLSVGSSQITGEYNATDKSSANNLPSTGIQTNLVGSTEWESVSWSGAEDFRVKSSTSVKLKNNASESNTLNSDIVGTFWNKTIGPWQIAGGGLVARRPLITSFGFGL